ncbi:surface lipoprotein assembly modifier [Sphingomonas tabacisoli]|uniref:Surface lipoprotein assembly modifier n=1 Tax=Sphingomonas tabacisoli TaxID=2249466 RepID=A0ABW4HZU6_9SPHN
MLLALLAVAAAASPQAVCDTAGNCSARLTGDQLLAAAENLVHARQFDAARPLIAALENVPGKELERRFLAGYVAVETGDTKEAIAQFRAILAKDPKQTRVRLELARALMMQGDKAAADHHLRLASQDKELPPEIAATIRSARGVIRDQRMWNFRFDFGLAPDTNINNATSAEQIDLLVSPNNRLPFTLNPDARARSGLGLTASFSGGLRLKQNDHLALLADADGQFTHYGHSDFNDDMIQLAVGPEFKLSAKTTFSVEAVGLQRWFGGKTAQQQVGVKSNVTSFLDQGQRVGIQFDVRHTESSFGTSYDGWQYGAYGTYERVVMRSMVASASLFVRRESLKAPAFSNTETGFNIGIGGELPHGINAGLSGGLSYAGYDGAIAVFSTDNRHDFRANVRAYLGSRAIRVLGFSPSITYTFTHNGSNYPFYASDRHRFRFALAHYF